MRVHILLQTERWRGVRSALAVRWCFFFQAEDGIRDLTVTGVQTCALPISCRTRRRRSRGSASPLDGFATGTAGPLPALAGALVGRLEPGLDEGVVQELLGLERSEERRVGKSVDLGGRRIIKKKTNDVSQRL